MQSAEAVKTSSDSVQSSLNRVREEMMPRVECQELVQEDNGSTSRDTSSFDDAQCTLAKVLVTKYLTTKGEVDWVEGESL